MREQKESKRVSGWMNEKEKRNRRTRRYGVGKQGDVSFTGTYLKSNNNIQITKQSASSINKPLGFTVVYPQGYPVTQLECWNLLRTILLEVKHDTH